MPPPHVQSARMHESFNAAMSKLAYWDTITAIDWGDICATRRLLQVAFATNAGKMLTCSCIPLVNSESVPLREAAGRYKGTNEDTVRFAKESLQLLQSFHEAADKQVPNTWHCVLGSWEVVSTASKSFDDMGALVFTDATLTRFVVTQHGLACCPQHVATLTAERANVFFSLAMYLGYNPKWVRFFGYGGMHHGMAWPPTILQDSAEGGDEAGWGQVDDSDGRWGFRPMLKKRELEKIDSVIASSKLCTKMIKELQDSHGRRNTLYNKVLNVSGKNMVPHCLPPLHTICFWCDKSAQEAGIAKLMQCSRCKIASYCSRDCQVKPWKSSHKQLCKAPQ